jgi:hypothetical protein
VTSAHLRFVSLIVTLTLLQLSYELGTWAAQTVFLADVFSDQGPLLQLCFKTAIIGTLCGAAMAAHFTLYSIVALSLIAASFFALGAGEGSLLVYTSALCVFFIFQFSYTLVAVAVGVSAQEE